MANAYNTSSAYKLPAYETTAPKRQEQVKLRKVAGRRKQWLVSAVTPRTLCVFAMAITVICLMVYNQVCLTEVTGEINTISNQLKVLENENDKMISELEAIISLHSVGEIAERELGLQKLDKYQTEYIYLYQEDKIELSEAAPKDDLGSRAKLALNSFVNSLKEYIVSE